jgi:hypothetical protein
MVKFKAALSAVVAYLIANPGAASLLGSGLVLAFAKLGLHVSEAQLAAIAVSLLPLVVGVHVAARKAFKGQLAALAAAEKPAEK